MEKLKLVCPCHFGLESVLKYEAGKIGGGDISVTDGRVSFTGGSEIMARANILRNLTLLNLRIFIRT